MNGLSDLTNEQIADIVKNADPDNFFMYAFIIFAFLMVVGMVSVVMFFIKKDTKKDLRQNEQYRDLLSVQNSQYRSLLDGYSMMIEQNTQINSEFTKTMSEIGLALRELTNAIARSEANQEAEDDKFELMMQRFDALKEEISRSNGAMHQAFREHENNTLSNSGNIEMAIEEIKNELKRNTDWCMNINKRKSNKSSGVE